ncbi:hypothetical protein HDU98_002517 [Podochytrium sp. JEL0797]|nr:hypothetical protein HDU98_002517 [Podochytrium sp. JEL0797]
MLVSNRTPSHQDISLSRSNPNLITNTAVPQKIASSAPDDILESQITSLKEALSSAKQQNSDLRGQQIAASAPEAILELQITSLKEALSIAQQQISDLRGQVAILEPAVAQLQFQNDAMTLEYQFAMSQSKQAVESEIESLRNASKIMQAEKAELALRLKHEGIERENLLHQGDLFQGQVAELESKLGEYEEVVEVSNANYARLKDKNVELEVALTIGFCWP